MPHDPTWRRLAPTGQRGLTADSDVHVTIALKRSKHRGERTVRLVVGDETAELHPDLAGEMAAELMTVVERSLYGELAERHKVLVTEVQRIAEDWHDNGQALTDASEIGMVFREGAKALFAALGSTPDTHRYTGHGHPCCHLAPAGKPTAIARCGGPALCRQCATEAQHIHGTNATPDTTTGDRDA